MYGMNSESSSIYAFLWTIGVIIVAWAVWQGRKNGVAGTTMVLKKFHIDESPSARTVVEIDGRASGIVSWLLSLLKLEADIKFVVADSEIVIQSASLSGIRTTYVPIEKVSASVCGYQRSILSLSLAVLFGLVFIFHFLSSLSNSLGNNADAGGEMGLAFGFLVLAGIFGFLYYQSKKISVSIESSIHAHGVVFKRSVIENVTVDLPEAMRAIALINGRILAAQTIKTIAVNRPASSVDPPLIRTPPQNGHSGQCPRCSTVNQSGTKFCENCGTAMPVWA